MKKITSLLLAATMAFSLTACGQSQNNTQDNSTATGAPEKAATVTITSLNANKEEIKLEVPYDAQRIAILDLAALDIIDNLGLGDRVVGTANT